MGSFLKYQQDASLRAGNGRGGLHFGRAHIDGAPFRGEPKLLREDEYEKKVETVYDVSVKTFDLANPEHLKEYVEVMDKIANGWLRPLAKQMQWYSPPDGKPSMMVYLEWTTPYKEVNPARDFDG